MGRKSLRQRVIDHFNEYGGWWEAERMAAWLKADVGKVRKVYDELEKEGLMDRQRSKPIKQMSD